MSDDLDALLRDHYRRGAESVRPDAELVARIRNATRPKRVNRRLPALAAAAAVILLTLVSWVLLRPGHQETPVSPPPPAVSPPMPTPSSRVPRPSRPPVPSSLAPSPRPTPTSPTSRRPG